MISQHDPQISVEPSELSNELFEAIKSNKAHRVNQLVVAKADPNSQDEKGITPMMAAVLQDKSEILKSLIVHKANVNITDNNGQTALHKAAEKGHYELFDTLLAAKADINCRSKIGETPLYASIHYGKPDITKYLLSAKANPNLSRVAGWTPLFASVFSGFEKITQSLISAKANVNQTYRSFSPLYFAAQNGYLNIVKMLVKAGAKVSLLAQSDKGFTPLIVAAETGKLDVVEYLLEENADLDLRTFLGRSAIFHAVIHNQMPVFKALVKAGADLHLSDTDGNTLLHMAANSDQVEMIQSLIDAKLDMNALNNEGLTPLLMAVKNKNKDAVLALLKAGADPNIKTDGETPLNYAVLYERPDLVNVLLEYKAKPDQRFHCGETLLSHAQNNHNKEIEEALSTAGASHIPFGQAFFTEPMQKTGLYGPDDGICFGLVCMAIQAYFSGGLQKLSDQVESVARTPRNDFKSFDAILKKNRKEWLKRALGEVCDTLSKQSGHIFTADNLWLNQLTPGEIKIFLNITEDCDEQSLYEKFNQFLIIKVYERVRKYREIEIQAHPEFKIPYLFEGVDVYQGSTLYSDLYPKEYVVQQQELLQTLPLFSPATLDPENIVDLDCVNGMYTKRELEFYFTSLYDAFQKFPGKIAFRLSNAYHCIGLFPSQTRSSEWKLLDPNKMPICNVSREELARCVLAAFKSNYVVSLHLEILVNNKDMNIAKECIQQWKSHPTWQAMQTVTPRKAQMVDELKHSFLRLAVIFNDLPLIKTILEMKANPDYADKKGFTALRLAAQNSKVEIIKLLQAHKASLEVVTDRGDTPLQIATQEGRIESVKYLLKQKVNVNTESDCGYSPLHSAAGYNRVDILPLLVEAKADIEHFSSNGETSLSLAAERGHAEMVKLLLSKKADINTVGEQSGNALYKAAKNGHTEVVQILIDAKADLSSINFYDTPLLIAVVNGHTEIVKNLLKIEPDELNKLDYDYKKTLLMHAVDYGHFEVAKLLLETKADPNIVSSRSSSNALYYAVENNSLGMVKLLLESGADPKQCDSPDKSSLELAIENEQIDMAMILLKYGAKPTVMCLLNAVKANDIELVKSLKAHGSDSSILVKVSPSEILKYLKQHQPDAVTWFEQYLQDKSPQRAESIEITTLELAKILRNQEIIQSLQARSSSTKYHSIFWDKIRASVLHLESTACSSNKQRP